MKAWFIFNFLGAALATQVLAVGFSSIESGHFKCSNSKTYDLARIYTDSTSEIMSSWGLVSFCASGVLKQTHYDYFFTRDEAHEDIKDCMAVQPEDVEACFEEYKLFNDTEGQGEMPGVIHPF